MITKDLNNQNGFINSFFYFQLTIIKTFLPNLHFLRSFQHIRISFFTSIFISTFICIFLFFSYFSSFIFDSNRYLPAFLRLLDHLHQNSFFFIFLSDARFIFIDWYQYLGQLFVFLHSLHTRSIRFSFISIIICHYQFIQSKYLLIQDFKDFLSNLRDYTFVIFLYLFTNLTIIFIHLF